MKRALLSLSALLIISVSAEIFPEPGKTEPDLSIPAQPEIGVDPDGNYLVNGKIRYLIGVQVASTIIASDLAPTSGYDAKYKWLYEEPLNNRNARRIGFDTIAFFTSSDWIRQLVPDYRRKELAGKNGEFCDIVKSNGLPTLVDFTLFPWQHGVLANAKYRNVVPEEAVNAYRDGSSNHWVPYNIFHPEGRKLYRMMWEAGVREMKQGGNPLMLYELFNEPAYDDPSPFNRKLFADFLRKRYATPEAMNAIYDSAYGSFEAAADFKNSKENKGLYVDWSKFMESGFNEITALGVKTIRGLEPEARICFQSLGGSYYRILPLSHVNLYEINRQLDAVSTPTGGGVGFSAASGYDAPPAHAAEAPAIGNSITEGILQRAFILALADGKPIHNPEAYTGKDYNSTFNRIWFDLVRGANATYLFEWSKRAWDWKPAGTPEGGKLIAEKFPWMVLNPYAYASEDFRSIQDAKKEIFRFADFFVPRRRNIPREVAVLISYPTERMAGATGYVVKNEITTSAGALAFTFRPVDAILEEQLAEGRQGRYRAIVATGVRNTRAETLPALRRFVEQGGVLIVTRELMPEDEYGQKRNDSLFEGLSFESHDTAPLAEITLKCQSSPLFPGRLAGGNTLKVTASVDWDVLAESDGIPVFLTRKFGKGAVYIITPRMQDYALGALFDIALSRHGIARPLTLRRIPQGDLAVNVEAHSAKRDNLTLHWLFNWDNYLKLAALELPEGMAAADLVNNRLLPEGRLLLPPQNRAMIGVGPVAALTAKFGALTPVSFAELEAEAQKIQLDLDAGRKAAHAAEFRYDVDLKRTAPLDLRSFANRSFHDEIAGDGKGGWTDQGRDASLEGVPWGVNSFLGVPCEIIRFDQNDNRTCIMLKNRSVKGDLPERVNGIPVNGKVRSLIFFHTAAWFHEGTPAMRYRIRYASGREVDVPVVCGENIGDWWMGSANYSVKNLVAWKNSAERGFYGWRWVNPAPDDEVRSFDIISSNTAAAPIVIAVSAEQFDGRMDAFLKEPAVQGFGNVVSKAEKGQLSIVIGAQSGPWSGVNYHDGRFRAWVRNAELLAKGVLKFEINGGLDQFGNAKGGQKLQVALMNIDRDDYRKNRRSVYRPLEIGLAEKAIDNIPETWQNVEIPIEKFEKIPAGMNGLAFQFRGDASSGVLIRNIRIELPQVDDPDPDLLPVEIVAEKILEVKSDSLFAVGKVKSELADGVVTVTPGAEPAAWSGFVHHFSRPVVLTAEEWRKGRLEFELDGGEHGGQLLQITLSHSPENKKSSRQLRISDYLPGRKILSGAGQKVTIPLTEFGEALPVGTLLVQYQQGVAPITPFAMKDWKISIVR